MAFKGMLHRLRTPISELDREKLQEFCAGHARCVAIGEAQPRREVSLVGEITTLRIVPHAGSPSLEATVSDGTGTIPAVWMGRRRIAGVAPGKRLMVQGRGAPTPPAGRLLFYNPRYELL